jgi:hypothetical protein
VSRQKIKETLMTHELFNILTRRASPPHMDVTEATAQARPITANAKKNRRKKGDVNKRCKQQAEEWRTFFPTVCPEGPLCENLLACTSPALAVCDFTGFLQCLATTTGGPAEATFLP